MMIKFVRYSVKPKEEREKLSFLKIKRLVLRLEKDIFLCDVFNFTNINSTINFALKYFDIENESENLFIDEIKDYRGVSCFKNRSFVNGLSDFFCSLYEKDIGFFQTFLNFIFKEAKIHKSITDNITSELSSLGYVLDNHILKNIAGEPIFQEKITSVIEDKLKQINPELVHMRNGAIESLLSNTSDKARHVSSSCRALINQFLRELVPKVNVEEGESAIFKRIEILFDKSKSTCNLVQETTNLIQALNIVQCKGDHLTIDESLAHFVFELTEKLIYFILISNSNEN